MKEKLQKNWYYIVIIVLVVALFIGIPTNPPSEVDEISSATETVVSSLYIYVDIKGEVANPGVYKLDSNSRLYEVISLAGGLTIDADVYQINMASLLTDEMNIYIPSIYDDVVVDIPTEPSLIDINQANETLLETLPGIGPSTATAIVDYRIEFGYFGSIEDIMNVPGIGETTYDNIKDLITI